MKKLFLLTFATLFLSHLAFARIKLTTLPERETVRIDIQNGRYTLVEEERTVNLQQGSNQVDFSWANISIDKESIVFRILQSDGRTNIINTNYPPNENALYWTISAEKAGPAVIRISYLIGNMNAQPSYQGIVEHHEKKMLLQLYMTVTNTSGEDFNETTLQPGLGQSKVRQFKNGERKKVLAKSFAEVDIEKRFIFDPHIDNKRTRMIYRIKNDKNNGLGEFPLPKGKFRLFIKEPQSSKDEVRSQAFLGEDWAQYTPLFSDLDLFIGIAQDVKVEKFVMQPEGGPKNKYEEVIIPRILLDGTERVTKARFRHERKRYRYRLQNFKTVDGKPVHVPLTIKEHVDQEWEIEKMELIEILGERNEREEKKVDHENIIQFKRKDTENFELEINLAPTHADKKYDLFVTVLRKNLRY